MHPFSNQPSSSASTPDPYAAAREMGIFRTVPQHAYSDVNAGTIVERIMRSRDLYEARQRAKGIKASAEEEARHQELMR